MRHVVDSAAVHRGLKTTEGIQMIGRHSLLKTTGRGVALAAVAALSISAVAPTGALAAPVNNAPAKATTHHGSSDATEFSARRRHYRGGGNAAGLAAFGAVVGTIGAIAAANSGPRYYDSYGYYGGGPAYYSGPTYYGGGWGPYRGYGGGHGYDNSRRQTW
jgi:hypothetical protein